MNRLSLIPAVLLAATLYGEAFAQLPKVPLPVFRKDTLCITARGANPDGITLNTQAINSSIDAMAARGGGVVLVPAGFWLTGPLVLKSNINLHLAHNAVLQFTTDQSQYPLVAGNWEGVPAARCQSPLSATDAQNIAITGYGIIDGGGDAWRQVKKDKLTDAQWKRLAESGGIVGEDKKTWYPSEQSRKGSQTKEAGILKNGRTLHDFDSIKNFLRPNLLVLMRCKKVLLEGVSFQNSPAWCLHPLMCEDLTVRGIYAKNPWYAQNGDGIDVESCKNVLLENSSFDVGDDGICIKSGRDEEGRKRGMPTENMIVRHCTVYHAHGGFVIGSEMSGGARNLYVYDCSFIGTDIGLRFKTTRGRGGVVEKIYIRNIIMKDIAAEAILFDMYYMARDPVPLPGDKGEAPKVESLPVTEATPQFRDFHVTGVVCNGARKALFIRGLPEMNIKDIWLDNLVLQAVQGIDCTEATGIHLNKITLITKDTDPVARIHNSRDISINGLAYGKEAELLFDISGEKTGGITVSNTNVSAARKKVNFTFGAPQTALLVK